ncbi:MAG: Phytanoyl-CoA dioxygenase [uncultured Sulfurovum sp.]|uniref:Phytanoyl-CoA dioxygenase n=1 Tax=uncultured Sulfurovum sp. TaxID=269237 RepID=A0A6S6THA0_9BACT|nr:MAG: Phytanoyl-CoA dioxygenase [uncultured Sulfurovum sp.]
MKLTQNELNEFNTNGFLVLRNFLDKASCEAILDVALAHLKHKVEPIESEIDYGTKSEAYRRDITDYNSIENKKTSTVRRLRQVYDRDILFKNWMENKKIRPILRQVLFDEVVLTTAHHNSIMTKLPNQSTETSWHQDRRYWSYDDNNLVSIWLALGEENNENGVLEFIPKSHRLSFSKEQFGEKEYFKEDNVKNLELIKSKCSTFLETGDVVIFHCKLLHRANKNNSLKPKVSFVYTVKGKKTNALKGSRSSEYREILLG